MNTYDKTDQSSTQNVLSSCQIFFKWTAFCSLSFASYGLKWCYVAEQLLSKKEQYLYCRKLQNSYTDLKAFRLWREFWLIIVLFMNLHITSMPSRHTHTSLTSVVCLVVLIGSLCVAMYAGFLYFSSHDEPAFVSLNVCDSGISAIFGGTDMPLLCDSPCKPTVPAFCCISAINDPPLRPLLVVVEKDRPPQS